MSTAKKAWAESNDDDNRENSPQTQTETLPDGSIRKTVVEFKTNEQGQKVKVTRKIKLTKTKVKSTAAIDARKKWRKFGDCANLPAGPEPGVTSLGEEIFIEAVGRMGDQSEKRPGKKEEVVNLDIVCRRCGNKGHWTLKCPFVSMEPKTADRGNTSSPTPGSTKYRPPGARGEANDQSTADSDFKDKRRERDENAIKVTNLSEDAREGDLQDLFAPFGPIQNIFVAKEKGQSRDASRSKGLAFITFARKEDAARAIERLNGFGYDHLILRVEWARK